LSTDDQATELLRKIEEHLSILTAPLREAAERDFDEEVLRTEPRKKMFRAFDGLKTPREVAKAAGTTDQAVRDLVRFLEPLGFIRVETSSGAQIASPDLVAIVKWHSRRVQAAGCE
jgi:hypothetical protein